MLIAPQLLISFAMLNAPILQVLIPFLMLIATIVVGEMVYSRRQHHSLTDCVATMLYFLLDGVQVGAV